MNEKVKEKMKTIKVRLKGEITITGSVTYLLELREYVMLAAHTYEKLGLDYDAENVKDFARQVKEGVLID